MLAALPGSLGSNREGNINMRKLLTTSLVAMFAVSASAPLFAQEQPAQKKTRDPNEVVCERQEELGTRLGGTQSLQDPRRNGPRSAGCRVRTSTRSRRSAGLPAAIRTLAKAAAYSAACVTGSAASVSTSCPSPSSTCTVDPSGISPDEDLVGERVLQIFLHRALQRPCAIYGVIADPAEPRARGIGEIEPDLAVLEQLLKPRDLDIDDRAHVPGTQAGGTG